VSFIDGIEIEIKGIGLETTVTPTQQVPIIFMDRVADDLHKLDISWQSADIFRWTRRHALRSFTQTG